MTQIKNIVNTCPSVNMYEKYLQNNMSAIERDDFEAHISKCNLCKEAIEGYKANKIIDLKSHFQKQLSFAPTKTISIRTFIQYAATVLLIISFGVGTKHIVESRSSMNAMNQWVSINDFSQFKTLEHTGTKKLSRKTSDQYLYLGDNKSLINDQMVNIKELNTSNSLTKNTDRIIIQVENNNQINSLQIINKIKEQHTIPVFTIRNIR